MNYLKKDPIDDLNDISYVNPEIENKSKLLLVADILADSFYNNIPLLLIIYIETINLIFIGHANDISYSSVKYSLFNYFAISSVYLNLFGLVFAYGILKSTKKDITNLKYHYIHTKILIILLIIIVIVPTSILSYYILKPIYASHDKLAIEVIWYLYTNYLLYAPIFILFALMFQINLRVILESNMRTNIVWISSLHIGLYTILLYTLVFYFDMKVAGVTLSLTIINLFSYIHTNQIIEESFSKIENFYLIPTFPIDWSAFFIFLKNTVINGFIAYFEYATFGFFLLFSFFIDETSLTANIIIMNFFMIIHGISQGYKITLKNYIQQSISNYKHSQRGRNKYFRFLGLLSLFTALIFCILISTVDGNIVNLYLHSNTIPDQTNEKIKHKFSQITTFYSVIIFFDYISQVLDGYVKGVDTKSTYVFLYKLAFLLIFFPLGIIFCFVYGFGLMAFWAITYIYIVIYAIINSIFVCRYYEQWMN